MKPDYKAIAYEAVGLLCSIGFGGLHPDRQQELWQRALDLDRLLNPHRPPVTVWTKEDGDVSPPWLAREKADPPADGGV